METLPDDIWYDILRMGIETGRLNHTDLCSLAIVNRHFDRLTMHSSHWADLISRDFPYIFSLQAPSKDLYRKEYQCRINRLDHSSYRCLLFSPEAIALFDPLSEKTEEDSVHQIIKRMHQINLDNVRCLPSAARYCTAQRINDVDYREGFLRLSSMNLKANPMARVPLPRSNVPRSRGYELDNISADGTTEDVPSSDHQQAPSLESYVGRPVTRRERKRSYENKPSKSSRPKAIPNSRSYVPMNRPPRRSMPRKI